MGEGPCKVTNLSQPFMNSNASNGGCFPVFGGGHESNATSVTIEDRLNEQPTTLRQWRGSKTRGMAKRTEGTRRGSNSERMERLKECKWPREDNSNRRVKLALGLKQLFRKLKVYRSDNDIGWLFWKGSDWLTDWLIEMIVGNFVLFTCLFAWTRIGMPLQGVRYFTGVYVLWPLLNFRMLSVIKQLTQRASLIDPLLFHFITWSIDD